MKLMLELNDEDEAQRALFALEQAGFDDVGVAHPYDGGVIISLEAKGDELPVAFEILKRFDTPGDETEVSVSLG
ncbi:MAG: hypothetical protein JNK82_03370 [Myxococcaceae bacterium]|nr:hypothetical protein [Myxococcaceae bacterium]